MLSILWRIPNNQQPIGPDKTKKGSGPVAARYGQDIVLRFTLKTAEEALAFKEASSDLFLDVWEFNEDWADIRLAKDTVCPLKFK